MLQTDYIEESSMFFCALNIIYEWFSRTFPCLKQTRPTCRNRWKSFISWSKSFSPPTPYPPSHWVTWQQYIVWCEYKWRACVLYCKNRLTNSDVRKTSALVVYRSNLIAKGSRFDKLFVTIIGYFWLRSTYLIFQ